MKKNKIYDKISDLHQEVNQMETEILQLLTDPNCRDYPKVSKLCDRINISLNQVVILEELVK